MTCPLCTTKAPLSDFTVTPRTAIVPLCATCTAQIDGTPDPHHWRALTTTMWSEEPAVQVLAWRMLSRLSDHGWAQDAREMLYLEPDTQAWAEAEITPSVIHRDSNGAILSAGDTVTLLKDLTVKGAGFTAKRGTAVRNISLVLDNAAQIEGRVNGQQIVILTAFTKKSG